MFDIIRLFSITFIKYKIYSYMCFIKYRVNYISETTQFLLDLQKKNPHIKEQQRIGYKLFWDQIPIDLDQIARDKESKIKQRPYVYQDY